MSSEDPTKNLSCDTQPTIQTILERLNAMEERLGVRLDRIASEVKDTHSELYTFRPDFVELRMVIAGLRAKAYSGSACAATRLTT